VAAGVKGAPLVAVSAVWDSLSPHLFWKSRKKRFSHERDRTFGTMASDSNFSGPGKFKSFYRRTMLLAGTVSHFFKSQNNSSHYLNNLSRWTLMSVLGK
jgi:hypothetical protein